MSDNRPVGVFDSGVGGLTVVKEIFKRLPDENIIYFGDTARVPYGNKSKESIKKFAIQDIKFLMKRNVKLIVAACHTVSSMVLDDLNQWFHFPVIGVVESGVNAAVEATKNNRIGVIGTRGTIFSRTYEMKLKAKNNNIKVVSQSCPLFVPLAEEGWLDGVITEKIGEVYLRSIIEQKVDTLILACTHYPLLKEVIGKIVGKNVRIIDSAEETAKLVKKRLTLLRFENDNKGKKDHKFFVTDIPHQFLDVGERFLGRKLTNLTHVDVESDDEE